MKKLSLALTVVFLTVSRSFSQDSLKNTPVAPDTLKPTPIVKSNPIIYADLGFGFGMAGLQGIMGTASVNYQIKHSHFTLKYTGLANLTIDLLPLPFSSIPVGIHDNGSLNEYALLYGLRFPKNGHAFGFSLGASSNTRVIKYNNADNQPQRIEEHYIGLPFELNIMWFKASKRRFRIYHIIPVGRPTGFGGSIGFKLAGNVSKYSYAALGIVYGLGYHKGY